MSKIFGDIRQLAFVVNDIDIAIKFWNLQLGIGPFFIKRQITFSQYCYRGSQGPSPSVSIALSNSGSLQIELIQQHDDIPSIYLEHLTSKHPGLHHVSSWMTSSELTVAKSNLLNQGYKIAQECIIESSGVQLVYFSTEHGPGNVIFEIADLKEPVHLKRIMNIKNASDQWNREEGMIEVTQ